MDINSLCINIIILLSLLTGLVSCEDRNKLEKKVIDKTIQMIEKCLHWGGETGDQDEKRDKEISDGVKRDCPPAVQKARETYSLYTSNPELSAKLIQLVGDSYYKVNNDDKEKICETASIYYKIKFNNLGTADIYFQSVCPKQMKKVYGE